MSEGAGDGTTLRLALGMRGGVSLAVWIGGAAAELDELRCARFGDATTDPGGAYDRALLDLGGYTGVQIDVMSGASAGGLNAVLAASAMIGQRRVTEMRETWLSVAALRELLESRSGDDGDRRSLLGGAYFSDRVHAEIDRLMHPPDDPTIPPLEHRLEVFLSATVHHGVHVQIEDDDYSPDVARRAGGLFHFRHLAATPTTSDLVGDDVADHLARAARTTASFPTAFEPICFHATDLPGVLLLPARPAAPVWLLDGGIVDNIPVVRAIEGVPAAPAIDDTDRWLIYLQPSPDGVPTRPSPAQADGSGPTLAAVAGALVGAFMSETILDDVEVLRRHNVEAIEAANAWQVSVAGLDRDTAAVAGGGARAFDATRINALLIDPLHELRWRPIGTAIDPSPLGAATSSQLTELRLGMAAVVDAHGATVRPFAPLARTAALLTGWARSVQRAQRSAAAIAGRTKLHCYQLMQLAQVLTTNVDLAGLDVAARPPLPPPDTSARPESDATAMLPAPREIVAAMAAACAALDDDAGVLAVVERLPLPMLELAEAAADDGVLAALYAGTHRPHGPAGARSDASAGDVVATMWRALGAAAWQLAALDEPRAPALGSIDVRPLRAAVRSAGSADAAVDVLRVVDELTAGVHHGVAAALPAHMQYLRIAGSNVSPLSLPADQLAFDGPRFDSDDLVARRGAVPASAKLAGVSLANFSAFISERWRANDWMWGRLDAAKSIVDVVTSKGRLGADHAQLLAAVERIVIRPFHLPPTAPASWTAELDRAATSTWALHRAAVAVELRNQHADSEALRLRTTKRLLVLRRHWELLAAELPGVLQASLRPEPDPSPDPLPPTLGEAIASYQRSPRSFNDVWGMRWSTALGIRAAYELWAATRPRTRRWRWLRAPLKPLPMSVLGTALTRNRGLMAMALSFDLVLIPRLRGLTAWLVYALGVLGAAVLMRAYRVVLRNGEVRRPERFAHAYQAGTVVALAAGAVVLADGRLHDWLYQLPSGVVATRFNHELIDPYAWMAAAVALATTSMLWCWARLPWRLAGSLVASGVVFFWAVFSRMRAGVGAGKWVRLAFSFNGMLWALVGTVVLTTSIAHFAFRRNWRINEYGRD